MANKWEYFVKDGTAAPVDSETALLNDKGKSGWELVAVVPLGDGVYRQIFKRAA